MSRRQTQVVVEKVEGFSGLSFAIGFLPGALLVLLLQGGWGFLARIDGIESKAANAEQMAKNSDVKALFAYHLQGCEVKLSPSDNVWGGYISSVDCSPAAKARTAKGK